MRASRSSSHLKFPIWFRTLTVLWDISYNVTSEAVVAEVYEGDMLQCSVLSHVRKRKWKMHMHSLYRFFLRCPIYLYDELILT